jgi:hypothetical protein
MTVTLSSGVGASVIVNTRTFSNTVTPASWVEAILGETAKVRHNVARSRRALMNSSP